MTDIDPPKFNAFSNQNITSRSVTESKTEAFAD